MPDYSKGKIYKIVCDSIELPYIGQTVQTLKIRLKNHRGLKAQYERKYKKVGYCASYPYLDDPTHKILLIEDYPCSNLKELIYREAHFQHTILCSNKNISCLSEEDRLKKYKLSKYEWKQRNRTQLNEAGIDYYKRVGKEKQSVLVECPLCNKTIRINNLKRHTKNIH
jgi:hypothetical protein